MHWKYSVPGKSYGRWRADPVLGARMAENVYDHRWQTNDQGFRDDEDVIDPKPEDALRIIAYGGSTTLCWNLPTEETWPRRLEVLLRESTGDPCHQVLNAGDIDWSIGHVYARASEEVPRLRPDAVILYSGINEVLNARLLAADGIDLAEKVAAGQYGTFARNLPQASWAARNLLVYKIAYRWILRPVARLRQRIVHDEWARREHIQIDAQHPPIPPDPVILKNYLGVLERLATLCRDHGAKLIFVRQARGRETLALEHFTSYSRAGATWARAQGITVVDAQAMVERSGGDPMRLFYDSGVHFSAEGSRRVAELIFKQALVPLLLSRNAIETGGTGDDRRPSASSSSSR